MVKGVFETVGKVILFSTSSDLPTVWAIRAMWETWMTKKMIGVLVYFSWSVMMRIHHVGTLSMTPLGIHMVNWLEVLMQALFDTWRSGENNPISMGAL